jgi:hypothetical protein
MIAVDVLKLNTVSFIIRKYLYVIYLAFHYLFRQSNCESYNQYCAVENHASQSWLTFKSKEEEKS